MGHALHLALITMNASRLSLGRLTGLQGCRYVNQSEPQLQGRSVTVKADEATIKEMHLSADKTFPPELAKLMQASLCFSCKATCLEDDKA